MSKGAILVLGDIPIIAVQRVAQKFDWEVAHIESFERLHQIAAAREVVAVLFDQHDLTWRSALESVRGAASDALPIVCHRFSDHLDWPQLADAGAFHQLLLPLKDSELMQSLGFVFARKGIKSPQDISASPRLSIVPAPDRMRHAPRLRRFAQA
jgi:hypothetical protein